MALLSEWCLMAKRFDEDDIRVRPPRSTRPRTKDRPSFSNTTAAMVTTVDRGRFTCALENGESVNAIKSRELGRRGVVVGDHVRLIGDSNGNADSLARIVALDERMNALRRSADDSDETERIIVANIDQLMIVTACADPEPKIGLVDRCLIAAYDAGISPVIVMTKSDLADPADFLGQYESLGVRKFILKKGSDLTELRELLKGKQSVFVGHSGVGKSTLVNALAPEANRSTGGVNAVTGRGRHTSSNALAVPVDVDTWIIDTPGIRSFGLAHVDANRIIHAFPDCGEIIEACPRSCTHDEEECALNAWASESEGRNARVESLRRLLRSMRLA